MFINGRLIEGTESHVNLPDFDEYKYDKVMRAAHQEVLFNIFNSVVRPNYAYKQYFYRDGAYATMVLKETGNIELIRDWVTSLTDVYDHARGLEVNEGDSPGELLYITSFFKKECGAMRDKVMKEIERIRIKDPETGKYYISGPVDGKTRANYSTKWLIFGMKAWGMDTSEYAVPSAADDDYADLFWMDFEKDGTWFHRMIWQGKVWLQKPISHNIVAYPYLNVARAHYYDDESYLMMNNLRYPLSWEGDLEGATNFRRGSFAHSWSAAELFLYLRHLQTKDRL